MTQRSIRPTRRVGVRALAVSFATLVACGGQSIRHMDDGAAGEPDEPPTPRGGSASGGRGGSRPGGTGGTGAFTGGTFTGGVSSGGTIAIGGTGGSIAIGGTAGTIAIGGTG